MAWFLTLASKMTGKEIPGVGMAPGGKIKKPKDTACLKAQKWFLAVAVVKNHAFFLNFFLTGHIYPIR